MANSALLKTILHNSISEGLYNEIVNKQSHYYYFLGRTISWEDEIVPQFPVDSIAYENSTRNEIITMKAISPNDVTFVVDRYNWISGDTYDQYDDEYSTELMGVNLISGGITYNTAPNVYIGSTGAKTWAITTGFTNGDLIVAGSNYYIVTTTGTSSITIPSHTTGSASNGTLVLQYVSINNGNGAGATAVATVLSGAVIDITLTHRGIGYTSIPTVIIAGGGGSGSTGTAVLTISSTDKQKIEDCKFYAVTDEFNVYLCLNNNNDSVSTFKPIGTTVDPITFADGYVWKFLYNIPIALRNKFLTDTHIPIITALRNQFYSNGSLQTVRVDQGGTGYTSASIVVQGDGYLESDPVFISSAVINVAGTGYTTGTIAISPPFSATAWVSTTLVTLGQKLSYLGNIYSVEIGGITTTTGPTHLYGTVSNGAAALKYIGTTATGIIGFGSGLINSVTLYGMIRSIDLTSGGSGYTSAPTVNITGGVGTGATAVAVMQNGSIRNVVITSGGSGYTSAPTITFGTIWPASTPVTLNQQLYFSNRLYTVTAAGTTSGTAPTHTSGAVANGGATLTYVGVAATATSLLKYGSGYTSTPTVTITGNGINGSITLTSVKSEANLVPILSGGQLVSVQINDGGIGYTNASLTVTGNGTGATISADLSIGDINTLQANVELLTIDGRIMNIPVISGGYGYGAASVTVIGDGTGCVATPTIVGGVITKITVTNYGSGYRWARVSISGTGYGAKARAIIGPYGGFGKEALNNLYARTLMFYTNISKDKNQGFDVNNDYRQVGIIKTPRQYATTYNLSSIVASACWVISATNNPALFPVDSIINLVVANSPRFRIVTNTGTSLLVQSLDNATPVVGNSFINAASNTFTVAALTPPTVDKYSGDLLFIDNKQAFTPTSDQTITLRTVIKF